MTDDVTPKDIPATATLRDQFAMHAMNAILGNEYRVESHRKGLPFRVWKWVGKKAYFNASEDETSDPANWTPATDAIARYAYWVADAMMKRRSINGLRNDT